MLAAVGRFGSRFTLSHKLRGSPEGLSGSTFTRCPATAAAMSFL
jgi:hypothetical protein